MEMGRKLVVLLVVLMAAVFEESSALSVCNMNSHGLSACRPSVTQPNPVHPTRDCCRALSGADLTCLCSYKNSFLRLVLEIDRNLAAALPAKCGLTLPADC